MYTDPVIVNPEDQSKRSYVSFYLDGKRHRLYSGNLIGLDLHPNRAKSSAERRRLLHILRKATREALKSETFPVRTDASSSSTDMAQIAKLLDLLVEDTKKSIILSERLLKAIEQLEKFCQDAKET